MAQNFLCVLFLLGALAAFGNCEEIDLEGRPTWKPEKEEQNIFDIISKQNESEVLAEAGRSLSGGNKTTIEGDIVMQDEGVGALQSDNYILVWPRKVWTSRVVPYQISGHHAGNIQKIQTALRDLETKVCVRFRRRRNGDKAWLNIYRGNNCWAIIGRPMNFGKTDVSIGMGCLSTTLIQHEIIHALGFFHEHTRRDRDNYVRIFKRNVSPGNLYNFNKVERYESETFGVPYDYESIMHYTRTTWTTNGQDTMQAKYDPQRKLGGTKLSKYDIMKLNRMYHCHLPRGTIWSEWSDWSQCLKNNWGCFKSKHRMCLVENLASCRGANKHGVQNTLVKCPSSYCDREAFDGFWGQWGPWSACDRTCDRGTRSRSRRCDSPRPSNGGKQCVGSRTDTERCMRRTCRPNRFFTNFDSGLGIWSNVQGNKDPLDWTRGRGKTSFYSGPTTDHTDGRGWYAYVSSASYTTHRKKATLVSPWLKGFRCVSFAYCMNGKNMGKLDVFAQDNTGRWYLYPFYKKGHQGKGWHDVEISLENPRHKTYNYRFFIEATIGIAPHSDIAIDDVLMKMGKCSSTPKKPNKKVVPPVIPQPKPKPKPPIVTQGCTNKNRNCVEWSKTGECFLNPSYMLSSCCLACRGRGDCKNENTYQARTRCKKWAETGECLKNKKWMWKTCCGSCKAQGKCTTKADKDYCKNWADKGSCEVDKYKEGMWSVCCEDCLRVYNKLKKENQSCVDKHHNCKIWANIGECQRNPATMKKRCCRACKNYKGCKNKNSNCRSWAFKGECEKNPGYMFVHCCDSCWANRQHG